MIKKVFIGLIVFTFYPICAQISIPDSPVSHTKSSFKQAKIIPSYKVKDYNRDVLLEEDKEFPIPQRYGVVEAVKIDLKKEGVLTKLENGKLWQYKLESENALSIGLNFSTYHIPDDARLWTYSQDYKQILGAFSSQNNNYSNYLAVASLPGNHAVIEYFEPDSANFSGELIIGKIIYGYRDMYTEMAQANELLDINCPQGDPYQLIKHSVCYINFVLGSYSYNCSGSLINNTLNDGKPYFLTANHCINDNDVAKTVIALFNYENDDCNGSPLEQSLSNYKSLSGASLIATHFESDFSLILFNNKPTVDYQPVYAGWNANNVASSSTFSIHHPSGGLKKMSVDYQQAVSYDRVITWDDVTQTPPNSHWLVRFDLGYTLGGSSGGPLFNKGLEIVGQLHGGDEQNTEDYYGKFSYSWNHSTLNSRKLKPWLDPNNSGVKQMGYYAPNQKPTASFTVDNMKPCILGPVYLYDKSYFNPTEWEWTITPGSYSFLDGTDKNSQNPVISFQEEIPYTIQLLVKNGLGNNSRLKRDYIAPSTHLNISINNLNDKFCAYEWVGYPVILSGATDYEFFVNDDNLKNAVTLTEKENNTFYIDLQIDKVDSIMNVPLKVIGRQSICIDSVEYNVKIIKPQNDNVENALLVEPGKYYNSFSNVCATSQTNEVSPPIASCNNQTDWCDEYQDGSNIVEKSVWFKFLSPKTGYLGIDTKGFDTQVALYQSDSSKELLLGNSGNYTLIAANDDYNQSDYSGAIVAAEVTAGKTYWIQVDGSGGGVEGEFALSIFPHKLTSELLKKTEDHTYIFPNPGDGLFYLAVDSALWEAAEISVYNSSGYKVFEKSVTIDELKISTPIDLQNLPRGIYILKCIFDNKEIISHKLNVL